MRVLGVDPGSRRIGLALSDEDGIIASPLGTVLVKAREQGAREVAAFATQHQVGAIVVGLPLRLDGSEGEAVRLARWFAERVGALTQLPITLWDERMSTLAAERALRSAGVRGSAQRGKVDRVAAALLLQSYLDAQRNSRARALAREDPRAPDLAREDPRAPDLAREDPRAPETSDDGNE